MNSKANYINCANELRDRIFALIPENPSILKLDNPWLLFEIPFLVIDDLEPTLFQARWALQAAKQKYRDNSADNPPRKGEKGK